MPEIHQFLDGFYLSRIGIRMLIGQHIALHEPPKPAHIGLICTKCSPWQVRAGRGLGGVGGPPGSSGPRQRVGAPSTAGATASANDTASGPDPFPLHPPTPHHPPPPTHPPTQPPPPKVAQDAINDARSICLREYGTAPDVSIYGDPSFAFAYVPSHLHHMVFELVRMGRGGGGGWRGRGVCGECVRRARARGGWKPRPRQGGGPPTLPAPPSPAPALAPR
jgi:hypothetical protein